MPVRIDCSALIPTLRKLPGNPYEPLVPLYKPWVYLSVATNTEHRDGCTVSTTIPAILGRGLVSAELSVEVRNPT